MKAKISILILSLFLVPLLFFGQGIIIQPGAFVTIQNGANLRASGTDSITLRSNASGSGSLVDYNVGSGITMGGATVERYMTGASWSWHFLSSPVTAQPIGLKGGFTTTGMNNGYDFYAWDEPTAIWLNQKVSANNITAFIPGKGYLVAYQAASPAKMFRGTLNSGEVSFSLTHDGSSVYQYNNLVGNPYPSSIDWKSAGWGTGRDHLAVNSGYDYWIWNGGTGTYGLFNSSSGSSLGTNGVNQYIAPGQGFFIKSLPTGSGSFVIPNAVRVHSIQSYLKNANIEPDLVRLKITCNANSYSDEMIVEFNPGFTGEGSDKFFSMYNEAPEIYSVKDTKNYSIDRYNGVTENLTVPVAVKTNISASYTIYATNISEFSLSNDVWLIDLKNGTRTNLQQTPFYTFTGNSADDKNRFMLVFGLTTGIKDLPDSGFNIYANSFTIFIRNETYSQPYTVVVSNILGQIISQSKFAGNGLNQVEIKNKAGVYVVKVISNGSSYSRKVVIR